LTKSISYHGFVEKVMFLAKRSRSCFSASESKLTTWSFTLDNFARSFKMLLSSVNAQRDKKKQRKIDYNKIEKTARKDEGIELRHVK